MGNKMRYNQNGIQIWDLEHCVAFREQKGFWAAPFLQGCVEDEPGKEIYLGGRDSGAGSAVRGANYHGEDGLNQDSRFQ